MRLHQLVRGAINSVNHDKLIPWLASTGAIRDRTTGKATPTFAPVQSIWAQIQPLSTDELAHMENLNIQGVLRQVYMKGAVASAVREDGTGGDLLQFPEVPWGPERTWLVMRVEEQWPSWCKVVVRMTNAMNSAWTADSSVTADTSETSDA
jgi:hypothetical protein